MNNTSFYINITSFLSIYHLMDIWIDPPLTVLNTIAMKTHVQVLFDFIFFLMYTSRVEFLGCMEIVFSLQDISKVATSEWAARSYAFQILLKIVKCLPFFITLSSHGWFIVYLFILYQNQWSNILLKPFLFFVIFHIVHPNPTHLPIPSCQPLPLQCPLPLL